MCQGDYLPRALSVHLLQQSPPWERAEEKQLLSLLLSCKLRSKQRALCRHWVTTCLDRCWMVWKVFVVGTDSCILCFLFILEVTICDVLALCKFDFNFKGQNHADLLTMYD